MDVSGGFDDYKPAIISAVIIMNITLNILVITVIASYPQLREDRTTLFIFSLTLSDLANGCTAMPISAAVCSNVTPNARNMLQYLPKIQQVCWIWFNYSSMHSLCWVAVCKMVAITKPLRYEQLLTRNRCYFIILSIWLTGAMLATSGTHLFTKWDFNVCVFRKPPKSDYFAVYAIVGTIAVSLVPLIVIVYATTKIFCAIVRTQRQITAQVNSISGAIENTSSLTLKSIRSGRNVLLICFAFLILTFPFIVCAVAEMLGWEDELPSWYKFLAVWIIVCNSSANSLIYLLLFRSVRTKTAKMISNCFHICNVR